MAAVVITIVTIAVILALNRGGMKIPTKLAVCIIGLEIVGTVMSLMDGAGSTRITRIKRPEAGTGTEEHEVTVKSGKREEKVRVTISDRSLDSDEIERIFRKSVKQIKREYLGENTDKDRVYKDLKLRTKYKELVRADWEINPSDVFDYEGKIDNSAVEKDTAVTLKVHLSCQGKTDEVTLKITAIPVPLQTSEGFSYYLKRAIADADEENPTSSYVTLPETMDGNQIRITEKKEDDGLKIVIFLALTPFFYLLYKRQKAKDDEKLWQKEMSKDYPKMIAQLTMYIGAGFSIKAAFAQVGNAYLRSLARGHPKRPAFEEVVRMNRKIRDGEDEERAYRNMGERLKYRGFRKLALLLTQSLRKNGQELRDQLEQEEKTAYEERLVAAKVAGEEASLKLLIPMIGLLGMIFIVLMVPAFMQMS